MKFFRILILFVYSLNSYCQYDISKIIEDGKYALEHKDYLLAIKYFNNIITYRPNNHEAYYYRASAKFALNDYMGSEIDLSTAIELNSFYYDAYSLRGLNRLNLKQYSEALKDYIKCTTFNSSDISVWSNIAHCYLEINKYTKADSVCNIIISQWPNNPLGYILKAKCQYNLNNELLFKQLLDNSIKISPFNPEALEMLALYSFQKGNWSSALIFFSRSLYLNPNNSNNLVYRGICHIGNGDIKNGLKDFNNALSINPTNTCGLYNRGALLYVMGYKDKSLADFFQICKINQNENTANLFINAIKNNEKIRFPHSPLKYNDIRMLSDTTFANRDKYVVDENDMNILFKPREIYHNFKSDIFNLYAPLPPCNLSEFANEAYDYPDSFHKGYESLLAKDYSNAIEYYNECILNYPAICESYYNRAFAYFQTFNYDSAISDLDNAIKLNKNYAEAYYNRGILYLRIKKINRARLDFSKAGELGIDFAYTIVKDLYE